MYQEHIFVAHLGHSQQSLVLTLVEFVLELFHKVGHLFLPLSYPSNLELVQLGMLDKLGVVVELAALNSPELSDRRGQAVEVVNVHLMRTLLPHVLNQVFRVRGVDLHYHESQVGLPLAAHYRHHLALPFLYLLQKAHIRQLLSLVRLQLVLGDQQQIELFVAVQYSEVVVPVLIWHAVEGLVNLQMHKVLGVLPFVVVS